LAAAVNASTHRDRLDLELGGERINASTAAVIPAGSGGRSRASRAWTACGEVVLGLAALLEELDSQQRLSVAFVLA
jgi:hypothetical protein